MSFEKKRRLKRPPVPAPEALVGKRVTSLAGHDRGRVYTVKAVFTDEKGKAYLWLSFEDRRARLKRKAVAHVALTDQTEQ